MLANSLVWDSLGISWEVLSSGSLGGHLAAQPAARSNRTARFGTADIAMVKRPIMMSAGGHLLSRLLVPT